LDIFPNNTIFISGHGREYSLSDIKKYKEMLITTTQNITEQNKAGKNLEDIQEEKLLRDYKSYGNLLPFLHTNYWIGSIYRSYKNKL